MTFDWIADPAVWASLVTLTAMEIVLGIDNIIFLAIVGLALCAVPASAQTADEVIAKYITTIGGTEELQAISTLRRAGKSVASQPLISS
jgi:hypothetical protein